MTLTLLILVDFFYMPVDKIITEFSIFNSKVLCVKLFYKNNVFLSVKIVFVLSKQCINKRSQHEHGIVRNVPF